MSRGTAPPRRYSGRRRGHPRYCSCRESSPPRRYRCQGERGAAGRRRAGAPLRYRPARPSAQPHLPHPTGAPPA
eukprot:scaffold8681_cov73-Isochrysis_galbana.AAC.1